MVVRVNVEVRRKEGGRIFATSAVANAGYEAGDGAEIHIPEVLAKELGFEFEKAHIDLYRSVGAQVRTYVLGYAEIRVVEPDKASPWIRARAVSVKDEYETLLSDKLIEELDIVLEKPASGLWRFLNEAKVRKSAKPQCWV